LVRIKIKEVIDMGVILQQEKIKVEQELENINDIKYSLILPKYDNSGNKIKPEVLADKVKRMAEHFGGVTVIPSVLGCWKDEERGELVCEENAEVYAIRNSEDSENITKTRLEDLDFIYDLAKEVGNDFGQASIMISNARTEMSFVSGEYKENLKEMTGIDFFRKLL